MLLQIISDLHLEFLDTFKRMTAWIGQLEADGVDVLVLAGDIADHKHLPDVLEHFCSHYSKADVIYCYGNHEYYGIRFTQMSQVTPSELPNNFHILDKNIVTIGKHRFIGGTLWFPFKIESVPYCRLLSDFSLIKGFEPAVYDENKAMAQYFAEQMKAGDIVVTHHYPCRLSTAKQWENHPTNAFFYSQMDDLIKDRKPALWVHGHTHDSFDYQFGETRIVCNPLGYPENEENPDFNSQLVIDI